MPSPQVERALSQVSALADPVRRALYLFVSRHPGAVSRDEAADGVGVARHVAKFNLDRLEAEGLLASEFSRPPGRGGPGAGRPAKRYRRSGHDVEVSLPERRYAFAGEIMARAIATAQRGAGPISDALRDAARDAGRSMGARVREVAGTRPGRRRLLHAIGDVLSEQGYEPVDESGGLVLSNCPFHALAEQHPDLVCGMNHTLLGAMLADAGAAAFDVRLEPSAERCCVTICRRTS